jgi:hypothetical protein
LHSIDHLFGGSAGVYLKSYHPCTPLHVALPYKQNQTCLSLHSRKAHIHGSIGWHELGLPSIN